MRASIIPFAQCVIHPLFVDGHVCMLRNVVEESRNCRVGDPSSCIHIRRRRYDCLGVALRQRSVCTSDRVVDIGPARCLHASMGDSKAGVVRARRRAARRSWSRWVATPAFVARCRECESSWSRVYGNTISRTRLNPSLSTGESSRYMSDHMVQIYAMLQEEFHDCIIAERDPAWHAYDFRTISNVDLYILAYTNATRVDNGWYVTMCRYIWVAIDRCMSYWSDYDRFWCAMHDVSIWVCCINKYLWTGVSDISET